MADVFISYCRVNIETMYLVRDHLKTNNISVWVDKDAEKDIWRDDVEKGIIESKAVIVLMSPDAKNSENVKRELSIAESAEKKFIPLLVDDNDHSAIPFQCQGGDYIDFRSEPDVGLIELISKLKDAGIKFLIDYWDPFTSLQEYHNYHILLKKILTTPFAIVKGPRFNHPIVKDILKQINNGILEYEGNENLTLSMINNDDFKNYSLLFLGYSEFDLIILRIADTHYRLLDDRPIFSEEEPFEDRKHFALLPSDQRLLASQNKFDLALKKIGVNPIRYNRDRQFPDMGDSRLPTELDERVQVMRLTGEHHE